MKLAINGGKPVREIPLPAGFPGTGVYGEEEERAVLEVIKSKSPFRYYGINVLNKVKAFELELSKRVNKSYALGVTSCTASLVVALKALGIGPGDKVIVPSFTFIATAGAVVCAGAVPIFVDIDESMCMDPNKIETLIDKYTRAIIAVPIQGNPCEMDKIMAIAKKNNIIVIEDVAQSLGSKYKGQPSGSFGDINCFSLQMNKIITTGEGGAIATDDLKLYERACRYHDQGMWRDAAKFSCDPSHNNNLIGQNYRMSEITGAVALEQIKKLDLIVSRLNTIKANVMQGISHIKGISYRRVNDIDGEVGCSLFMLMPDKKLTKPFMDALNAENINCSCFYNGIPIYNTQAYKNKQTLDKNQFPFNQFDHEITYYEGMCPVAEDYMSRNVAIIFNPAMTEKDVDDIVEGIKKVSAEILV